MKIIVSLLIFEYIIKNIDLLKFNSKLYNILFLIFLAISLNIYFRTKSNNQKIIHFYIREKNQNDK